MGTEALWMPILGSVAGSVVSSLFGSKKQDAAAPIAQISAEPAKPAPQASAAPDVTAMRNQVAGAAGAGEASTLLTGIGGIDPKKLSLGKATLLGE